MHLPKHLGVGLCISKCEAKAGCCVPFWEELPGILRGVGWPAGTFPCAPWDGKVDPLASWEGSMGSGKRPELGTLALKLPRHFPAGFPSYEIPSLASPLMLPNKHRCAIEQILLWKLKKKYIFT